MYIDGYYVYYYYVYSMFVNEKFIVQDPHKISIERG